MKVCICDAKVRDNTGRIQGVILYDLHTKRRVCVNKRDLFSVRCLNLTVSANGKLYCDTEIPVIGENQVTKFINSKDIKRQIVHLYHGSRVKNFTPQFGLGQDKHDYGNGFYMTPYKELAKEWALCSDNQLGWLHSYILSLDGLKVFNFNSVHPLHWLAELMAHRDAASTARYKRLAPEFIKKFKLDISAYDVIYGWRADSSYFSIGKRFVNNEIDFDLINELFHLGNLENQVCLKSRRAFNRLVEIQSPEAVGEEYKTKYKQRDSHARETMTRLINSERNTMTKGFDYVLREDFKL